MAIYEICVITEAMRKLIVQKRDGGELKQCAVAQGMETLRQDGWRRVAQGKTTIEEVVRVTQNDEVMSETSLVSRPALGDLRARSDRLSVSDLPAALGLAAQRSDRRRIVVRAENRSAGDEHIRSVLDADLRGLRIDPAIDFDVES